jgi:hypothetical protein
MKGQVLQKEMLLEDQEDAEGEDGGLYEPNDIDP